MKHFMIKYQFANGTTEEWHREIGRFHLRARQRSRAEGKDHLPLHEEPRRFQLLSSRRGRRRAGHQDLQARDFFKHYTEKTRQVAGGDVVVTPMELIAETA